MHKIIPSKLHGSFSPKLQCVPIFFNIFLRHKMSMLTAGIWDEDNNDDNDDDKLNNNFDDEEVDSGLVYLIVISEIQVQRKVKWVHQCLNWFAHVKKLEHENILYTCTACLFKPSQHL